MCVSVFVDLKGVTDDQDRVKRSSSIQVRCEETIVPGVWGSPNEIALNLAVNPGEEDLLSLFVLVEARVSDP